MKHITEEKKLRERESLLRPSKRVIANILAFASAYPVQNTNSEKEFVKFDVSYVVKNIPENPS